MEFVAWYGYDSFNRRVSKSSLYEETWYGYDGWRMLEEYDGGWNAMVSYFDGIGIDEHLGMARFDGATWSNYAFIQDQLGNVVRVLDDQGSVIARYEYDQYGQRTLVQGSPGFNIAYGFTGRYHDVETDLLYYRNRYFSSGIGRFLTHDPSGMWRDASNVGNASAYVGNSPVHQLDPMGWSTQGSGSTARVVLSRYYLQNHQRGVGPFADGGGYGVFTVRVGPGAGGWPHTRLVSSTPWKGRFFDTYAEAERYRDGLNAGQKFAEVWSQAQQYARNAYEGLSLALSAFPGPLGALSGLMDLGAALYRGDRFAVGVGVVAVGLGLFGWGWIRKVAGTAPCQVAKRVFCFPSGTKIATPHGDKAIEDIRVGDDVYAWDFASGQRVVRKVKAVFQRATKRIIVMSLDDGRDTTTTSEHPFWVVGRGWVKARCLTVGMRLLTMSGKIQIIVALSERRGYTAVYNFETDQDHNYFAGSSSVLVHNQGGDPDLREYNSAINEALKWLRDQGVDTSKIAGPYPARFGDMKGKPIGIKFEGGGYFRIEFDVPSRAHINAGVKKLKSPHFKFKGSMKTVNTLISRLFNC